MNVEIGAEAALLPEKGIDKGDFRSSAEGSSAQYGCVLAPVCKSEKDAR